MNAVLVILSNIWAFLVLIFHISYLWPWAIIKKILPKKQKDICGEIIFITGAGSGMGRGIAIKFSRYGAKVICTDIDKDSSDQTVQMIQDEGGIAYSYQLDVTDRHKVYALAETVRSEVGDVTMLVNNAGIVTGKKFMDCPDELMIKTMEVNTISHFWTMKAFLGPMIKKNHGHLVSIASAAGYMAGPRLADYSASKFGAMGLYHSIKIELAKDAPNVKTSAVCPSFVNTGMFTGLNPKSPYTFPLLETEYTVDAIISGILNDEKIIFVPSSLMFTVIMTHMLPSILEKKILDYYQVYDQMAKYTGGNIKKTN